MTRLNNEDRMLIVQRAMNDAFKEDFTKAEDALARECFAAAHKPELLEMIPQIPTEWLRLTSAVEVRGSNGYTIRLALDLGGSGTLYEERAAKRLPQHKTLQLKAALTEKVMKHVNAKEEYQAKWHSAEKALQSRLAKISTYKKLRETWPEGEVYYNDLESKAGVATAIMIPFNDINKMLGLPKDVAA